MVGSSIRTEVFVKDVFIRHSNLGEKLDRVGDEATGPADVDLAGLVCDEPLQVGGVVFSRFVLMETGLAEKASFTHLVLTGYKT